MIDPGLKGRVAIVTGANNPEGIGAAVARTLIGQGVAVLITSFGEPPPTDVVEQLLAAGGRAASREVDLSDPAAITPLFDDAEARFGPVKILVANAAASDEDTFLPVTPESTDWAGRPVRTITAESHDQHFAVNSRGTALLIAEHARRHIARGADWGRIVTISTGGAHAFPGEISYGASKLALESYSRAAALELAPYGLTVNIVSPGPIQTGWIPPDQESMIACAIPMGRVGLPQDVANAILLLVTEQAGWLTGQILQAGGGHKV